MDDSVPVTRPSTGEPAPTLPPGLERPERIGRYRVERVLGEGSFGVVYLARDEDMQRAVAVKVPTPRLLARPGAVDAYLREAQILARLDHPHIVTVFDLGRTDEGGCFIVSKYLAGGNLADLLRTRRPAPAEAAALVAAVAEALDYAHQHRLVHRDVKPGNILLDAAARPYLADFGIALRDEDFGTGEGLAGTPFYMSPEQARGESHRVDGRADVYSLGAVLYELLTGQVPFRRRTVKELLDDIASLTVEARPPRQLVADLPHELERVCLKAVAKRAAERYTTARDFAEDLRAWLARQGPLPRPAPLVTTVADGPTPATPATRSALGSTQEPGPEGRLRQVVPKGLRAFDAEDKDFFVELLQGPRDRRGLPDSLRFWKTRVETTDPEKAFAVGLLYGPSGCGKSSLVKAGLLPRLGRDVVAVYVEAAAGQTEARLLRGLARHCPGLDIGQGLTEALAALRRGAGPPPGGKVLLVLDQFEQFLHEHGLEPDTVLVRALRQCDGVRVQALLLVRDDFWLAVTRFLDGLEINLVQGYNTAVVDLFDPVHARKVLAAFGRAHGRLADDPAQWSRGQQAFLDQVVAGLAQDGRVIPVRLALFAEMVKGKAWEPATLKAVGGTQGVGVAFLEESLAAASANPRHRLHQKAVRGVLRALLPERGTDIKGAMRSALELQAAAHYSDRPREFADLMHLLDAELRLVTPTDPEAKAEGPAGSSTVVPASSSGYYQLTHDYLVPAVREWLTRKQKETRRGRAELRLAERAALWQDRQENRHLPAWWEWLSIRLLTRTQDLTEPQRRMMNKATRYYALSGGALAALLAVVVVSGMVVWDRIVQQNRQTRAEDLVQGLLNADLRQVPGIIKQIQPHRPYANEFLRRAWEQAADGSPQQLRAALALLRADDTLRDGVCERLLDAAAADVVVLRDELAPHAASLRERLWEAVERPPPGKEARRLRAACALAAYDPEAGRWDAAAGPLVAALVAENPVYMAHWLEGLRPVREPLRPALEAVFRGRAEQRHAERSLAANVLVEWFADQPDVLAGLLLDADAEQFRLLLPRYAARGQSGLQPLEKALHEETHFDWKDAPLADSWATPPPDLVRRIEEAGGVVAELFALCQELPLAEFVRIAEALRAAGFRPIRCRPYAAAQGTQVAAVWTRDSLPWQMSVGLSPSEVRREFGKQNQKPVDVSGYLDGDREYYAALWVRGAGKEDIQLHVGAGVNEYADAWQAGRKAKVQPRPRSLQTFVGHDGTLRYSAIWGKGEPATPLWWEQEPPPWDLDEATYANGGFDHGLPVDVSMTADERHLLTPEKELSAWLTGSPWPGLSIRRANLLVPHPERCYAGTFAADAHWEAVTVQGLAPAEHLARCRELERQGYRPVAISVAPFPSSGGRPALLGVSVWHRPVVPDADKERLAKRQANAAVALMRLGRPELAWPLLRHRPDPRLRSYLLHRLSPLGADARALVARLDAPDVDVSEKRALLLALGEFGKEALPQAERQALLPRLLALYRDDPDPGLHAAAEWLLRTWARRDHMDSIERGLKQIDERLREADLGVDRQAQALAGGRRWYFNGQGQTMVVLDAREPFLMGSPRTEAERYNGPKGNEERQHWRRIGRTFALASREVTVAQFRRFRRDHNYNQTYSPADDYPMNTVGWYRAAEYCNWLSRQEGIPEDQWCYEPHPTRGYDDGMRAKPDFLNKRGYRLPTEAEWEYACRAGAVTARPYGETEELLGYYAWHARNPGDRAMRPVGSLKPNDFGLFDMLGNASERCHDGAAGYAEFLWPAQGLRPYLEDLKDDEIIYSKHRCIIRGGAFTFPLMYVRSAFRMAALRGESGPMATVRPARTYP
jgi:formylglycine-generating enzyme required for sulfatase activity